MEKYVIEREVPGVGRMTPMELKGLSLKSLGVLRTMGTGIQWLHSYVVDDKIYCIYLAENETLLREHALKGGLPLNSVKVVRAIIDPATAS